MPVRERNGKELVLSAEFKYRIQNISQVA